MSYRTPFEKAFPQAVVGSVLVLKEYCHAGEAGDEVVLNHDDGTSCPDFRVVKGKDVGETWYINLERLTLKLEKVKELTKAEKLEAISKRMTRVGSKLGRATQRVEELEVKLEQLRQDYKAEKAKPEVIKITDAAELVELMHDPLLWKAGMRVVNREDTDSDVTIGQKYTLTMDVAVATVGWHGTVVQFKDNGGDIRHRGAEMYQLVTKDLV